MKFLGEGGAVQFRAEFFNVLNHPTFKFGFLAPILFFGSAERYGSRSQNCPRATNSQIRTTDGDPRQYPVCHEDHVLRIRQLSDIS